MKIYAFNGSPRKQCNTAQMLQSFVDGIKSIASDTDVEFVNLYDYTYTGCRSCFACQLKKNRDHLVCQIKDEIHDILDGAFRADGLIFASPIYFFDITAQLRAFLERLMYPGVTDKSIPMAFIYTMNANKEQMEEFNFEGALSTSKRFLSSTFHMEPDVVNSFNTYQYNDSDSYNDGFTSWTQRKKALHDLKFKDDLRNAYEAGARMEKKS
jgi:multimeric flavodoxin WrbA